MYIYMYIHVYSYIYSYITIYNYITTYAYEPQIRMDDRHGYVQDDAVSEATHSFWLCFGDDAFRLTAFPEMYKNEKVVNLFNNPKPELSKK